MENEQKSPSPSPLMLTSAQIVEISMTLPSVYANNAVYTSTRGGVKFTFVETTYEGSLSPRMTVFLPAEVAKQFYDNLGEFMKRIEATASAPEAPTTRQ